MAQVKSIPQFPISTHFSLDFSPNTGFPRHSSKKGSLLLPLSGLLR